MRFEEKDFEGVASSAIGGDTAGAIGKLTNVLATVTTGHPLIGVMLGGATEALAKGLLDGATKRFEAAGQQHEDEAMRRERFRQAIRDEIRPLLVTTSTGLSTLSEQQTEQFVQLIRFMQRNLASLDRQDEVLELLKSIFDQLKQQARSQAAADIRRSGIPTIAWKCRVGIQAWKHRPIVAGTDVLVGSAGTTWNEPDEEDGVYCLDEQSGERRWFAHTPADANDLLVSKGVVVTGCDDGTIVALHVRDGSLRWSLKVPSGIVGGPIQLSADMGDGLAAGTGRHPVEPVFFITFGGEAIVLDIRTGQLVGGLQLNCTVVAAPTKLRVGRWKEQVAIPCTNGRLVILEYEGHPRELRVVAEIPLTVCDSDNAYRKEASAKPVVSDDLIIQGLAGATYGRQPPLVAYDATTHRVRWVASTVTDDVSGSFGNLRAAPLVVGEEVVFAAAYTRGLAAVSLATGELLWRLDLGQGMFEQWSPPVLGEQCLYLGRHDGYLHKVDPVARKRCWSLFLGEELAAGGVVPADQVVPEIEHDFAWKAGASSAILSVPTVHEKRVYVGTAEGFLFAIDES